MSSSESNLSAIDQYGEVWFLGGYEGKSCANMGLDLNMDTKIERYISRPLCSNQMRKTYKIALKVESFVNFTAVMTRDIVTDATGVVLLTGNIID